ncbi:MAG: rRNA maturation RNase YbeY [Sulfurospirillaceae bacterium]|nr:rRNA maturation RNase YbeY [Sulfurospirillaceae bacterium]MDD2826608.1 rRNA maturation RNase YbeY [Sulfurospirillaceae bacterium]
MLLIDNESNIPLHVSLLEQICSAYTIKEVELLIVDATSIKELNHDYRGIDKATDVLSFPVENFPHSPLGSIVINYALAGEKAEEFGHAIEEEITLLFIHGLLHLLGYDHECDHGEMRDKEEALIKHYNLPSSLIVRTQE